MKIPKSFTPSLDHLAQIIDGRRAAGRERQAEGQRHSVEARKVNTMRRRRAHWKKPSGGICRKPWSTRLCALPGWQMLVARLEPQRWHAMADIRAVMPEYAAKSSRVWTVTLWRLGLVERAANPLHVSERGDAQHEPMLLYRLTVAGEALALEFHAVLRGLAGVEPQRREAGEQD